ncbi:MAG: redoxin domain-containing protein [Saprospiraceae bacterium]|nr:redoxin domain-containing protein [Saprospiraceae bacterium]
MKYLKSILILNLLVLVDIKGQSKSIKTNLSAIEFSNKIKEIKSNQIIDVRTPEEFSNGHISGAINYDWNGNSFDKQIALLNKSKPVFVYCLSGGRSSSAAQKMRSVGFKIVYELSDGIMSWRAANLPETTNKSSNVNELTKSKFDKLLESKKLVLIDFYAEWCAPCKKMKPYLDEISKEMSSSVEVIRINADENKTLCKTLGVATLPFLLLYKNKSLVWKNKGYIDKTKVVNQIHKATTK